MKIIRQRQTITTTFHFLTFTFVDNPSAGFSFPVDSDGEFLHQLNPTQLSNLKLALHYVQIGRMNSLGVKSFDSTTTSPALGLCPCGFSVLLSDPLDNTCDHCGLTYNSGGQQVIPSSLCDSAGNPLDY